MSYLLSTGFLMQFHAILHVSMVFAEEVMKLDKENAIVPVAGMERDVMSVRYLPRNLLPMSHSKSCDYFLSAICEPGCENGGFCKSPGYCQCPPSWRGQVCEERKFIFLYV